MLCDKNINILYLYGYYELKVVPTLKIKFVERHMYISQWCKNLSCPMWMVGKLCLKMFITFHMHGVYSFWLTCDSCTRIFKLFNRLYIEAAQNNNKCAYHNFGEPVNFYKLASKQRCNSLCVYDQVTINMHMCVWSTTCACTHMVTRSYTHNELQHWKKCLEASL